MTESNDRIAREVLTFNRNGWKLYEIAELYGFTKQRASQLRIRALNLEIKPEIDIWFELNPRTRNALKAWGCGQTPDAVVEFCQREDILRVPSIGKKCIGELQAWLTRHGRPRIEGV